MRTLAAGVLLLISTTTWAQVDEGQSPPPPPPPSPRPAPVPLQAGVQFHGEVGGSTTGVSASVSAGIGFNRVAILLSPSVMLTSGISAIALALSVRVYFASRQQGALVGFIHPEASIGGVSSGFGSTTALVGGVGLGGGVEYLLTRNLGFTAELGVRYTSLSSPQLGGIIGLAGLTTGGSFGLMLHQ